MMLRALLLCSLIVNSCCESLGVFDDNILFDISWPGFLPESNSLEADSKVEVEAKVEGEDDEPLVITTLKNEKYRCIYAPDDTQQLVDDGFMTSDADAVVLLTPLFNQKQCLYRVESYWSYELCIGKHLRQYHEERSTAQTIKMTEYYLGRSGSPQESVHTEEDIDEEVEEETKGEEGGEKKIQEIPTWHYDGMEYPYFRVEMKAGTPCDLRNNDPRITRLLFICVEDVVAELIHIKEVTTCEYEAVVATSLLCFNKEYKIHQEQAHSIKCYAVDDSPTEPTSLVRHKKTLETTANKRGHIKKQKQTDKQQSGDDESQNTYQRTLNIPQGPTEPDPHLTKQFLLGEYCITGGTGWWKHELCHERYVKQFHRDANGKTEIILGKWDKERHIKWITENPKKITNTQVVHYYTGGDICDITKQPRECQVKIKCVKSMMPTQISIYIQEPSTCKYILTVETSFLCPLIEDADEHGMLRSND